MSENHRLKGVGDIFLTHTVVLRMSTLSNVLEYSINFSKNRNRWTRALTSAVILTQNTQIQSGNLANMHWIGLLVQTVMHNIHLAKVSGNFTLQSTAWKHQIKLQRNFYATKLSN